MSIEINYSWFSLSTNFLSLCGDQCTLKNDLRTMAKLKNYWVYIGNVKTADQDLVKSSFLNT